MKYNVMLKATLTRGELYWGCDVEAEDEDDALVKAEALFMEQLEDEDEWSFEEAEIEAED
jgi:hypothetical protein